MGTVVGARAAAHAVGQREIVPPKAWRREGNRSSQLACASVKGPSKALLVEEVHSLRLPAMSPVDLGGFRHVALRVADCPYTLLP